MKIQMEEFSCDWYLCENAIQINNEESNEMIG